MKSVYLFAAMVMVVAVLWSTVVSAQEPVIKSTPISDYISVFNCNFGRHSVNVTAFGGPDGVLLVDASHRKTAQALKEKLTGSELGPPEHAIRMIINTHLHGDHTGGNDLLGSEATIIAHENVRARLSEGVADSLVATLPGLPDSTFTDSLVFEFNGETVEVIHLPNGHTDGDAIVHFVSAKVVCLGDLLFADAIPLIFKFQGGGIDGFIASLDSILSRFPDGVSFIPGHGRVYSRSELAKYRDMLSGLTERVRAEFRVGKTTDEVFGSDVLAEWKDWVSQEFVSDSAFILMVWDNDRDMQGE